MIKLPSRAQKLHSSKFAKYCFQGRIYLLLKTFRLSSLSRIYIEIASLTGITIQV